MFLGALLKILEDSNNTLVVSAATAREIASQWSQGKPWQAQAVVVLR
jgi:PIN domain nuclease of toxin-antitoxin system